MTDNSFKFNGKAEVWTDPDRYYGNNALLDYGARYYNPVLARWTSVDPLADESFGVSPYAFCYNNPVMFIDPDGCIPTTIEDPDTGYEYEWKQGANGAYGYFRKKDDHGGGGEKYIMGSSVYIDFMTGVMRAMMRLDGNGFPVVGGGGVTGGDAGSVQAQNAINSFKFIVSLIDRSNHALIVRKTDGISHFNPEPIHKGESGNIYEVLWNPSDRPYITTAEGNVRAHPFEVFGHEFGHGMDMILGFSGNMNTPWWGTAIPYGERFAMTVENWIRTLLELSPRLTYVLTSDYRRAAFFFQYFGVLPEIY